MEEINLNEHETFYFNRCFFEALTKHEKALVVAYRNHLLKDTPVEKMRELMFAVNEIHERHPNFNVGCIP